LEQEKVSATNSRESIMASVDMGKVVGSNKKWSLEEEDDDEVRADIVSKHHHYHLSYRPKLQQENQLFDTTLGFTKS
jgi:hypothetical protein